MTPQAAARKPGPVVEFAQHVGRLHSLLDQVVVATVRALGLSRSEFDVLAALASQTGPVRPGQLSTVLLLTTGGLSNILGRLERGGLVERIPETSDARSLTLRLTEAGRARATEATRAVDGALERFLAPLTVRDRTQGNAVLHRILESLGEDAPVHRAR